MNRPRKHHYIPAFYLQQWAGADGNVCQFMKIAERVARNRKHPNATGYQVDLYRIEGLPPENAQIFEEKFMHYLDTDAYRALVKITDDEVSHLNAKERSAWVRFLLGFLFRTPEAIALIKAKVLGIWDDAIEALEAKYAEQRKPGDPPTLTEKAAAEGVAMPHINAAQFVQNLIDNQRLGPFIFEMNWGVVWLPNSDRTLLTSDRPVNRPYGLKDENAFIALPIAPRKLFVACNKRALFAELNRANQNEIVRLMNVNTVTRARKFVWGLSDDQHKYVQRYMCSADDIQLISDEKQVEVVADERGTGADLVR
jgi:hypothetical protein